LNDRVDFYGIRFNYCNNCEIKDYSCLSNCKYCGIKQKTTSGKHIKKEYNRI